MRVGGFDLRRKPKITSASADFILAAARISFSVRVRICNLSEPSRMFKLALKDIGSLASITMGSVLHFYGLCL